MATSTIKNYMDGNRVHYDATANSTYVSQIAYQTIDKFGEIVVAQLNFRISASATSNVVWMSGFPIPKVRVCFFIICGTTPIRCMIDEQGNFCSDTGYSVTGWCSGNVSYRV